ncbi:C45 family autoproteolytic acyltransferase/hydrolase [Candidatus Omnitrophota bacterium]
MRRIFKILLAGGLLLTVWTNVSALGPDEAVVVDKVILSKSPDTYMEMRHIVLRGSNREIGKALGDIAREWLGVKLGRYAAPVYAEARRRYLKKNYPALSERSEGVAESYGLAADNDVYITSQLFYDIAPFACSAVYYPQESTDNGHVLFAHNLDFYITTMRRMIGMEPVEGDCDLFSRNFIMEMYPDEGYASIVIGSLDLLNGGQSGMNSEGLIVAILADNNAPESDDTSLTSSGDNTGGLNTLQTVRLLLDNCADVEEAKIALLNNKFVVGFEPSHFLIGDRFGDSFIFETASKDFGIHFTDNNGRPQVMTNHAVYLYPDVKTFPEYPPSATYNSFYRYRALYDYLQGHEGKVSADDAMDAMSLVYAHTHDADEGAARPTPCRTLWTMLYDVNERSVELKFYLKDGPVDPGTGDPTLVFTDLFKFELSPDQE